MLNKLDGLLNWAQLEGEIHITYFVYQVSCECLCFKLICRGILLLFTYLPLGLDPFMSFWISLLNWCSNHSSYWWFSSSISMDRKGICRKIQEFIAFLPTHGVSQVISNTIQPYFQFNCHLREVDLWLEMKDVITSLP